MPSRNLTFTYWDSNIFLSYFNGYPDRIGEIESVLEKVSNDATKRIVASSISIVEVSHVISEKTGGKVNTQTEADLDAMWNDPAILLTEVSDPIAFQARDLIREAIAKGWTLKPYDAVHLATAMWIKRNVGPVDEIHTYDTGLDKYNLMTGIFICRPHVLQPKLIEDDMLASDNA
jgi:predicted nucleic acid-binding protein